MFDERAWRDLDLTGRVDSVQVSIDAAEADTYAIVRRPGNFAKLLKNLAFVKSLREFGDIPRLEISMVVQALNFREMPAFVRLGLAHCADTIVFEMIRDWGVYTPEAFAEVFVGPGHPEHPELLRILEAPELADTRRVALGNVAAYAQTKPSRKVA